MELSIRPVGQGGRKIVCAAAARTADGAAKTKTEPTDADRLELSRAAMSWVETLNDRNLQERERQEALKQKLAGQSDLLNQLDSANETADAQGENFRVMERCFKIASNIMSGKRVPPKDLQYLMEHDPKLYQLAVAMRRSDKDDKECDPVVKDEDEEASTGETGSGLDAPSAPADSPGAEAPSAPAKGGAEGE